MNPKANEYYLSDPAETDFSDYFKTVPLWVNTCLSEFTGNTTSKSKDSYTDDEVLEMYTKKYGNEIAAKRAIELFRKAYPNKSPIYGLEVDVMTRRGSVAYVEKKAEQSGDVPAYSGVLAYCFPIEEGKSAWHCADLPFIFHNCEKLPLYDNGGAFIALERQMSGALLAFMKTGNPNCDVLPEWKPASVGHVQTMTFDEVPSISEENFDTELLNHINASGLVKNIFKPGSHPISDPDGEGQGGAWLY